MERVLPEKKFLERNSLLTDLYEITHIRTVYNIFMVTFILLLLDTAVHDIIESGTLVLGTVTICNGFAKLPTCLYIWSLMLISTFGVYVAFNFWSSQRLRYSSKSLARKLWDYSWLTIFIIYQVLLIIIPNRAMIRENLGIVCNIIIIMEQLRIIMKNHAFVRSVTPRFLSYKPHNDVSPPNVPRFSHYLYFLFAPTIIYRDEYPRTKKIRWMFVCQYFGEVVLVIFYYTFILERLVAPVFRTFDTWPLESTWFIKIIIGASIPGFLFFMSSNYLLLHAWMNAWAEMLRFADRLFYKDWWNSTSFPMWNRTWNVIVHDWLYTYLYKDMYEIVVPRNKPLAIFTVFLVSGVCHEYIAMFALRFFYPVMLILFGGLNFVLVLSNISFNNLTMCMICCLSNGIIMSTYAMVYYTNYNCLSYSNYYADLLLPQSWNCQRE
ncbi:sterol O-acyltransferase 1-like [Camponotus floridanus]|uniref:sterol O-acyltransferase 1-like n=1 Tax=Camponotus floridanus TaxID=104421 RepID=UPI000DC6A7EA|nr:sterol O-acyltransferase 1-like [Camponotus floridanus]XP_025271372.1 sterol O-acyltransferase 1-like [Camponotus floridanus]XP_025271373.1 sterol O-acyltransferase 1-like [Camponotus floridanus]XP_025271374.1 sterol O-acyltransferase 1-like [Camponotus floridanus]XP_025271375.1 sterol O-acyltransferase 1-like [Camponotus floridanus]